MPEKNLFSSVERVFFRSRFKHEVSVGQKLFRPVSCILNEVEKTHTNTHSNENTTSHYNIITGSHRSVRRRATLVSILMKTKTNLLQS